MNRASFNIFADDTEVVPPLLKAGRFLRLSEGRALSRPFWVESCIRLKRHFFPGLTAVVFMSAIPSAAVAGETTRLEDWLLDQDCEAPAIVNPAPFEIADWLQLALYDVPTATLDHYALGLRLLETLRQPAPDQALAPDMSVCRNIIMQMSASADWRVRLTAAELARELRDPQLTVPLAPLIDDPDWPVRQRTILALGRLGSGRNIETLMAVLARKDDGHWFERESATKALGEAGNTAGMLVALSDPKEEVRRMAVRQLGRQPLFDAQTRQDIDRIRRKEKNQAIKAELKLLLDRK